MLNQNITARARAKAFGTLLRSVQRLWEAHRLAEAYAWPIIGTTNEFYTACLKGGPDIHHSGQASWGHTIHLFKTGNGLRSNPCSSRQNDDGPT